MLLFNLLEESNADGVPLDHDARESSRAVGRMVRRMKQRSYLAVQDFVHDMEDNGFVDDHIAKTIETAKPDVIAWFNKQLSSGLYAERLIDQIFLLMDIGVRWPEITALVEQHKDTVLKALLTTLSKNANDSVVIMHMRGHLEMLTRMGIRWSEIRGIWKSVSAILKHKNLDEASGSDKPDWYDGFVDYIGDTDITQAVRTAKYAGVDMHNSKLVADELNSSRSYLMRYFERCLGFSFNGFEEIAEEIGLLKSLGVDWPELDTFWDDNRDQVIVQLLKTLASGDEDAAFYTWQELEALKKAGVDDWPEIRSILKSVMAALSRPRRGEVAEASDDDWEDRQREMRYDDDSWFDARERKREAIWDKYSSGVNKLSNDLSDLGDLVYQLENDGADGDDVAEWLEDDLPWLLEWFTDNAQTNDADSVVDFIKTLDDYKLLGKHNADRIISNVLDHHRDQIIRQLLTGMANGRENGQTVNTLRKVVDWSELGSMIKSINVGRIAKKLRPLEESSNLLSNRVHSIINQALIAIREGGSYYIRTLRDGLAQDKGVTPAVMSDIFGMNKSVILHAIEKDLTLGRLKDAILGIGLVNGAILSPWPELTALINSSVGMIKKYVDDIMLRTESRWTYGFHELTSLYEQLTDSGLSASVAKEIKLHIRDAIVKKIRDSINQGGAVKVVTDGLAALDTMGIRVDIGTGKIKDKLMAEFRKNLAEQHQPIYGTGDVRIKMVKLMLKFGNEQIKQEMMAAIEDNRENLIRNILFYLANRAGYAALPMVTMLQHLGFKWDELRAIDKSIKGSGYLGETA